MREQRDGQCKVETGAEAVHPEGVVRQEVRPPIRESGPIQFDPARLYEGKVQVEAVVVAWVQVADEAHAAPQGAAPDVEQPVMGP